jgi:hypothetical protein
MARDRRLVFLAALCLLGQTLTPLAYPAPPPGDPLLRDSQGNGVRPGNRIRIDPSRGRRFSAEYLLAHADSLRLTTEDGRTLDLPFAEVDRLEVYRGTREQVHPILYVLAGAAFVTGGVLAYSSTKDQSEVVRVLAAVGGGMLGVWVAGTAIPHGGGMHRVDIWIQVPLDP